MEPDLEAIMNEEDDIDFDNEFEVDEILQEDSDSDYGIDEPLTDRQSLKLPPVPEKARESPKPEQIPVTSPLKKVDPVDLLDAFEREEMSRTSKDFSKNLKSRREFQSKKQPAVSFEELPSISSKFTPLSSITGVLPSSIAVSVSYVAIGNTNSQILVFSPSGRLLKDLEIRRKEFGEVAAMDIDPSELILVSGYEHGEIAFWDLKTGTLIRACNTLHKSPVIALCFHKPSTQFVVSADASGKLVSITLASSMFTAAIRSDTIPTSATVLSLQPLIQGSFANGVFDLLAVASIDSVSVYTDDFALAFLVNRPGEVSGNTGITPCISWTTGDRCPMLALAWNLRITLYEFWRPSAEFVSILGVYDMDLQVKATQWLSPRILLGMSKMREVRVISLSEFSKNSKKHFAPEDSVPRDIVPQAFVKDTMSLYNSFRGIAGAVYILGKRELSLCRLLDWKESIDKMVDKKEWLQALCFGLDIYEEKLEAFSSHSKEDVRTYLENMISEYVKLISVPLDQKIPNTIEFCVAIDAIDLLFNDFFEFFIDRGFGKETLTLFMDTLEPYIMHNEICQIPSVILGRIAGFYLSFQKQDILERLILHLEPSSIEMNQIIPICRSESTCLMFLHTHNMDFESSFVALKSVSNRFLAYKLLWFVRLCLRGKLFPEGDIPESEYPKAVSTVMRLLVSDESLLTILAMDTQATLDVILEAFKGQAKSILGNMFLQETLEKLEKVISGKHQLTLFIAKVADEGVISKKICINTVNELVKPHRKHFNRSFAQAKNISMFIDMASTIDSYSSEREPSTEEKCELILKMLKNCELEREEIEDLAKKVVSSPYSEVLIYLNELRGKYKDCLKIFLRSEKESIRKKVFSWLYYIREKIGHTQFEGIFLEEIMDEFNKFMQIDADKTARIVNDWYTEGHIDIINKLNDVPELQMKYLGELISNSYESDLEDSVFSKYIELLCVYSKDDVLSFLKKTDKYSIEDALEICIKHSIHGAISYLYKNLGELPKALKVYRDLIHENLRFVPNNMKELQNYINKGLKLCQKKAKSLDESDNIDLWFPFISDILGMYQEFHDSPIFYRIERFITDNAKGILESMIDHISFDDIIAHIDRHFGNIPFKFFKDTFIGVLSRFSYQTNILKTATSLLNGDIKRTTQDLYQLRKQGISFDDIACSYCYRMIDKEKIMKGSLKIAVFMCGHVYHQRCIANNNCLLCDENKLNSN